nr:hypothetical protein Itr_chr08CG16700 [Ipomoea trifida]
MSSHGTPRRSGHYPTCDLAKPPHRGAPRSSTTPSTWHKGAIGVVQRWLTVDLHPYPPRPSVMLETRPPKEPKLSYHSTKSPDPGTMRTRNPSLAAMSARSPSSATKDDLDDPSELRGPGGPRNGFLDPLGDWAATSKLFL